MQNKQTKTFIALSVILFFSGSFSLIYQIAWVRFLTLLLGSTTMGITTVVATFMSGLAVGSWLASKYLINKEKPLKVYAFLEFIISITAFISPLLFKWAFSIIPELLQNFGETNANIFFIRILFSAVIMLIPTICMGATLPVLGKYLQQYSSLAERRISIIYGLNTIGASAGCIVSGYFLLREMGLINTIYVTAFANALLAIAILLVTKFSSEKTNDNTSLTKDKKQKSATDDFIQGISLSHGAKYAILLVSAIVGFIGLASELVWTRLIVLSVGGSIYAYSTILAVYLFFYGIGAALGGYSLKFISQRYGSRTFDVSRSVFFILLLLIPVATTATIAVANLLPDFYINNFIVERSSSLYGLFISQLFPAIMLMGAATLISGLFFSYGLFMMKQTTDNPAANTSFFYTWNTVGGIAGTIIAAFFLIPYFGLDPTLRITSTLLIVTGLLVAFLMKIKKLLLIQISGFVCLIIVWFIIPDIYQAAITAGAGIKTPQIQKNPDVIKYGVGKIYEQDIEMIYYKDGFTATITVTKNRYTNELALKTNGKGDGSSYTDMPTQKLLGHFTALFHPKPENACVIGFGTGTTVGSMAMHPGINVDAIEIEPAVIEGSMLMNDFNNNPLERNNVNLLLTDGRLHLQRSFGKYDIILSEPSNPWISGVSDLFTVEFYKLGYEALTADGVFGQWIHMYSLKPEALQLVFRSFQEVFPETYMIFVDPGSDLLLIGVKGSYRPLIEDIKKRISLPEIAADIEEQPVNIKSAYELFSRLVFGPEQTRSFAGNGPVNTDIMPILSYMAPLSLFDSQSNLLNKNNVIKHWTSNINILGWNQSEEEVQKLKETQEQYLRDNFLK